MGFFTFYIIPLNYGILIGQILIFGPRWVQNVIIPKKNLRENGITKIMIFFNTTYFGLLGDQDIGTLVRLPRKAKKISRFSSFWIQEK